MLDSLRSSNSLLLTRNHTPPDRRWQRIQKKRRMHSVTFIVLLESLDLGQRYEKRQGRHHGSVGRLDKKSSNSRAAASANAGSLMCKSSSTSWTRLDSSPRMRSNKA